MELMSEGLQPVFLPLDVDSEESILAAKEAVQISFGRLDVLINNAAVMFRVSLLIVCWIIQLIFNHYANLKSKE